MQGSEPAEIRVCVLNLLNAKFKTVCAFFLAEVRKPLEEEPRVPFLRLYSNVHIRRANAEKVSQREPILGYWLVRAGCIDINSCGLAEG